MKETYTQQIVDKSQVATTLNEVTGAANSNTSLDSMLALDNGQVLLVFVSISFDETFGDN